MRPGRTWVPGEKPPLKFLYGKPGYSGEGKRRFQDIPGQAHSAGSGHRNLGSPEKPEIRLPGKVADRLPSSKGKESADYPHSRAGNEPAAQLPMPLRASTPRIASSHAGETNGNTRGAARFPQLPTVARHGRVFTSGSPGERIPGVSSTAPRSPATGERLQRHGPNGQQTWNGCSAGDCRG